ncbi:MAG: hypothetical protein EBQ99_09620, partial [Planctomycetes bacterium]|nr:hypothetical protein [Planctomycetota bacterium]
ITQVACGGYADASFTAGVTYALKSDGTLIGWGNNVVGQTNTPGNAMGITQVACGGYHNYMLRPWRDCDENGIFDLDDISAGAIDFNTNGRIDDCELAKGDFDLSGEVDAADLSIILLYFGEFDPVFGDLDGDGEISGGDIASLLVLFGPVTW